MGYDDLGVLEVVDALFPSPMAVTAHAGDLVQWMQNPADPGGAEGEDVTAGLAPLLGQAAALGVDPGRILRADPVEAPLLVAALEHAAKLHRDRDEALAKTVVAELAAAQKRGSKKR